MVAFLYSAPAQPGFSAQLPHQLLVDEAGGVLLLSTPCEAWQSPALALGCAWAVEPRTIEVLDDSLCLDIARLHESMLKALPIGAAFQTLWLLRPATGVPAWEALHGTETTVPAIRAQTAALRAGLPYQDGLRQAGVRERQTFVTLRLPVLEPLEGVVPLLLEMQHLALHSARSLAGELCTALATTRARLESVRYGVEDTLRGIGHRVRRLDGLGVLQALALTLDPTRPPPQAVHPDVPLREQVMHEEMRNTAGGWGYGYTAEDGTFLERQRVQLLSLSQVAPEHYPGILCAPRAPDGTDPLGLWQAWQGPMSIVTNVAVAPSAKEVSTLKLRLRFAKLHALFNVETKTIVEQLETFLAQQFLSGGKVLWGRVHVALWGEAEALPRGLEEVQRQASRLRLGFEPERLPIGSTLFLQTLLLGFDPLRPSERALKRARRVPSDTLGCLLTLYGAMQGTRTPAVLYLNTLGEAVTTHPADSATTAHKLTIGTGGAGKTFDTAQEVQQFLSLGESVVIVDPLTNYRWLCALCEGTVRSLSLHTPECFNPLYGTLDTEHVARFTAILGQMASGSQAHMDWEQFNVANEAATYFARTWDATVRGEPTLTPFIEEVLEDGCFNDKDARARRIGRDLARRLRLFYRGGIYSAFLDGPNTFTLHPGLTVIEVGELDKDKDLQGILFFAMAHVLPEFFRDPVRFHRRKHIRFDEMWALSKYEKTAEEIEKIFRTSRNYGLSAGFVAHRAEDLETPMGAVIRALTGTKLFLQQNTSELPVITKLLELSPPEAVLARQARKYDGWSSGYLQLGEKRGGMVRILPDPVTYLVMSQDSETSQRRARALEAAGGDMRQAVQALLAEEGYV